MQMVVVNQLLHDFSALMEHQAKRKAKMAEHLQESCLRLEALRRDVAQLQQQLHDRRKAKVNFTITVSAPHKIDRFF